MYVVKIYLKMIWFFLLLLWVYFIFVKFFFVIYERNCINIGICKSVYKVGLSIFRNG